MSYCRCGEDSDVYAYCGGPRHYMIHVGDPHGENPRSYTERSLAKFRERLIALRAEGLLVPQRAIDRCDREMPKLGSKGRE